MGAQYSPTLKDHFSASNLSSNWSDFLILEGFCLWSFGAPVQTQSNV